MSLLHSDKLLEGQVASLQYLVGRHHGTAYTPLALSCSHILAVRCDSFKESGVHIMSALNVQT